MKSYVWRATCFFKTYIYISLQNWGRSSANFWSLCVKYFYKLLSVNSFKLSGTDNPKNYRGCDAVALVSVILRKNMFHLVSKFYAFLINKQWWWKMNTEMNWYDHVLSRMFATDEWYQRVLCVTHLQQVIYSFPLFIFLSRMYVCMCTCVEES